MSDAIIITGARAPVAQDLARACRAAGYQVNLADSQRCHAARALSPAFPLHRIAAPRQDFAGFRRDMLGLIESTGAAQIIPTCEEVFWLSAAAQRDGWSGRLFAPDLGILRQLHSKALFADFGSGLGIPTPVSVILDGPINPTRLPFPPEQLVLKPEYSRFASHTVIAPTPEQIAVITPSPARRWVAQQRIEGEEVCSWAALHGGEITAFAAYRPRWRQGNAAAFLFEAIDAPEVRAVTEAIGKATGMSGHLSFDLIIDRAGVPHPIECNPRAVSGLHLFDASAELGRAVVSGETCPPPRSGTLRHMGPAMAMLGLPKALFSWRLGAFCKDWRNSQDVIAREQGLAMHLACIRDAATFARQALKAKRSPASATTADIEWDGEAIG